jgi:Domain of unknown function (DUF5668)
MTTDNGQAHAFRPGAVMAGAILMALGAAMLLDRTGIVQIGAGQILPPLVLIGLGVMIVLDKGGFVAGRRSARPDGERTYHVRRRGDSGSGIWLIGIGAWMLVSKLHLFGLSFHTSWPLFIVLSGVMLVIRGAAAPEPRDGDRKGD